MKKISKVLAIYTILISLFIVGADFVLIDQEVSVNSRMAWIALIVMAPIIIFSALVIFYSRGKKEEKPEEPMEE